MQSPAPQSLQISLIQARQQHRLHRVQMLEPGLCRVSHGTKRVFLGEQSVAVGAGQWLLLPANIALDIDNEPDARGYLAQVLSIPQQLVSEFHQGHAQHWSNATAGQIGLRDWRMARHPRLDAAWQRLLQSLVDQEPVALQKHLLHEVLLILGLSGHLQPLLGHADGGLSMRLQQLLMSDPSADWSQDAVAARFHMSSPTLRRHLAAEGQTFREILDSVRMAYALSHLQTTRRSIDDIAHACGYASASRFAVRFRQRFGLSPRALRQAI
jgi:AraC-like DNA-binding protein